MATHIPVDIAQALLPTVKDHIALSHVYTSRKPDIVSDDGVYYYKIPQKVNIHWTHFCPHWLGNAMYEVGLVYKDTTNEYELSNEALCNSGQYHTLHWPLPGVIMNPDSAFYLTVQSVIQCTNQSTKQYANQSTIQIEFVGFEDILSHTVPDITLYDDTTQWVLSKNTDTGFYDFMPCNKEHICQYAIPISLKIL